jgi:hypothetical protein
VQRGTMKVRANHSRPIGNLQKEISKWLSPSVHDAARRLPLDLRASVRSRCIRQTISVGMRGPTIELP